MQPTLIFKDMIKNVAALLKEYKYSRYGGNIFYTSQNESWGFIGFQKSLYSSRHDIRFTINLGVCSKALFNFYYPEKINQKPSIHNCQWQERIGFLLPSHDDKWWSITEQTIADQLFQEIHDILKYKAIPKIELYSSDKQLESLWLSKTSQASLS